MVRIKFQSMDRLSRQMDRAYHLLGRYLGVLLHVQNVAVVSASTGTGDITELRKVISNSWGFHRSVCLVWDILVICGGDLCKWFRPILPLLY